MGKKWKRILRLRRKAATSADLDTQTQVAAAPVVEKTKLKAPPKAPAEPAPKKEVSKSAPTATAPKAKKAPKAAAKKTPKTKK